MKLNKQEKQFLRKNKRNLSSLFERRIDELQMDVFTMSAGQKRDMRIEFIKEFKTWLDAVDILTQERKEEPLKSDFV